jgi:hypothetical protein
MSIMSGTRGKLTTPIVGSVQDLRWSIDFIRPHHFLLVKTQGPLTSCYWALCAKAVVAATAACQCAHLLIDHRDSPLQFSTLETYNLPKDFNTLNPPLGFVAAVVFARPSDQSRFLDDRFANTRLPAQIFYDFDRGKEWLLAAIRAKQEMTPPPASSSASQVTK